MPKSRPLNAAGRHEAAVHAEACKCVDCVRQCPERRLWLVIERAELQRRFRAVGKPREALYA